MAKRQRNRNSNSNTKQKRNSQGQANTTRQKKAPDESTRLWLDDMDSGVSEDTAYEASGAATGGGVDTPTAVEKSTEATVRRRKPVNQGSSAHTGGGADNGSDL